MTGTSGSFSSKCSKASATRSPPPATAVSPKPFLVDEVLDTVHRLAGRVAPWHISHSPEEKTK